MFGRIAWSFRRRQYITNMMMGEYSMKQGEYTAAAEHFSAAVAIAQQNRRYAGDERIARPLTNCAAAKKKLKRYDEAIRDYKEAIAFCRIIPAGSATEVFYAAIRNLARLYGDRSGIQDQAVDGWLAVGHGSYPIDDYWLAHVLWALGTQPDLLALVENAHGVQTPNTMMHSTKHSGVARSSPADPIGKQNHYLQAFANAYITEGGTNAKKELLDWLSANVSQIAEHIGLGKK